MSTRFASSFFAVVLISGVVSLPCAAQQTTPDAPAASQPPAQQQPATSSSAEPQAQQPSATNEKQIEKKEQSQRVMGVLPQFAVTSRQDAPPLTTHEKFHLFIKSSFDPVTLTIVGLQAGLAQAENEFPAYGQGAQGYGKRFGASFADSISSGFWSNFFYPTLFKEDPRYFRSGEGSFGHRFAYGIKQEFVCHTDKGGRSFNFSNVLGAFTSGAISNLYYPGNTLIRTIPATGSSPAIPVYENDRGVSLTLSRASIALAYGTLGGLFDEFWPDIHNKISHKHKAVGSQTSAPSQ